MALANLGTLAPQGGVPDTLISGLVSLTVPSVNADAGGGIYVPPAAS
jgi:hypothetical protein